MRILWTENQLKLLRELWNGTRLSAKKIGEMIGDKSRSAVIARASRDPKCESREHLLPQNLAKVHKPAKVAPKQQEGVCVKAGRPKKVYEAPPLPDTVRGIPFKDTGRNDCMFILDEQHTCCGNQVMDGKPWCEYHFNITHEKVRRRRKK